MIFVPLPLFATVWLFLVLIYLIRKQDMIQPTNQLFAGLVGLFALQSLLLSLRWGYQLSGFAIFAGILAPVLPVAAYFAYLSLMNRLTVSMLWPLAILGLNWIVLILIPDLADPVILMTYLSFGIAILRNAKRSGKDLALVRIGQTGAALRAMVFTGAALIGSAFMDMFVIVDFIRTDGQNIGFGITLAQSGLLLFLGLVAISGRSGTIEDAPPGAEQPEPEITEADSAIIIRLTKLFEKEAIHTDTDLSLRRLSRKLGVPDRSVSKAINKTQNLSVSQFVNRFRIEDACRLLEQTDQTILQVSMAAGFMSKSNFNREFARVTTQTPSQWRQAARTEIAKAAPKARDAG